jgi:hypothetical protein
VARDLLPQSKHRRGSSPVHPHGGATPVKCPTKALGLHPSPIAYNSKRMHKRTGWRMAHRGSRQHSVWPRPRAALRWRLDSREKFLSPQQHPRTILPTDSFNTHRRCTGDPNWGQRHHRTKTPRWRPHTHSSLPLFLTRRATTSTRQHADGTSWSRGSVL